MRLPSPQTGARAVVVAGRGLAAVVARLGAVAVGVAVAADGEVQSVSQRRRLCTVIALLGRFGRAVLALTAGLVDHAVVDLVTGSVDVVGLLEVFAHLAFDSPDEAVGKILRAAGQTGAGGPGIASPSGVDAHFLSIVDFTLSPALATLPLTSLEMQATSPAALVMLEILRPAFLQLLNSLARVAPHFS